MHLSPLDLIAVLRFPVALFGWINLRALHLPMTVGLMAIGLAVSLLVARLLPVSVPAALLARTRRSIGYIPALTWSGTRAGISIALALTLPPVPARSVILSSTRIVMLFSTFVQSMSLPRVMRRLGVAAAGTE